MEPNGDKRRGFAVGDLAREAVTERKNSGAGEKPWPRSGQPHRWFRAAKCRARFCAANPKVGPMTARAVSPQAKCDRTGARAGRGTEAAWGKEEGPAVAGRLRVFEDNTKIVFDTVYQHYCLVASIGKKRVSKTDIATGQVVEEMHLVAELEQRTSSNSNCRAGAVKGGMAYGNF